MIAYELNPPIEAWGHRMYTLEDAAYVVRKFAIESDDSDARKLVRFMRDVETLQQAIIAESRLRAWMMTLAVKDARLLQMNVAAEDRSLYH